jgi:hypothetical protein
MSIEYKVISPMLPPANKRRNPESPIMDSQDMEYWLNDLSRQRWELVSYGSKHWHGHDIPQEFWIFKRKSNECTCPEGGPECEFFDMETDECLYGKI